MTEDRLAELMVKTTDGLATPSERAELDAHLREHPALATELEAHMALRDTTDALAERLQLDAHLDALEASTATRAVRSVGFALLLAGTLVLVFGGATTFLLDPEVPWWAKLGLAVAAAGGALLAGLVVQSWWSERTDPYKEVKR